MGPGGTWQAGRVRYKAPHAVDLGLAEHRDALESLARQLERDGWMRTGETGQADHSLRFSRSASNSASNSASPASAASGAASPSPSLADRVDGLTKHTKRFLIFFGAELVIAAVVDAFSGRARLLPEWPSLLSIAVALVWALAATDDFRGGTHNRIPKRVEGEGVRHPIGWYRAFLTRVVLPNRTFFGWLIPGSMYPIALAYLSGILVQLAAIGALFLLANMFLFLNLNPRHPRDDYVMLTVTQLIILVTNPGGVPAILRALGVLG